MKISTMKTLLSLSLIVGFQYFMFCQENLFDLEPDTSYENILVKRINGDDLSTQFVIWVKDTVRTHRHEAHSESLFVLSGKGVFYMNDKPFKIEKGDFITINKNNWHAVKVTSEEPLKVLSVQSPEFTGEDRKFKHP